MTQSAIANGTQFDQVDRALEQRFERLFQAQKVREAGRDCRIKLDENVYITPTHVEVIAEYRAKRFQPADPMQSAQLRDGFAIVLDKWMHARDSSSES